jgi:hypothetical protein
MHFDLSNRHSACLDARSSIPTSIPAPWYASNPTALIRVLLNAHPIPAAKEGCLPSVLMRCISLLFFYLSTMIFNTIYR